MRTNCASLILPRLKEPIERDCEIGTWCVVKRFRKKKKGDLI